MRANASVFFPLCLLSLIPETSSLTTFPDHPLLSSLTTFSYPPAPPFDASLGGYADRSIRPEHHPDVLARQARLRQEQQQQERARELEEARPVHLTDESGSDKRPISIGLPEEPAVAPATATKGPVWTDEEQLVAARNIPAAAVLVPMPARRDATSKSGERRERGKGLVERSAGRGRVMEFASSAPDETSEEDGVGARTYLDLDRIDRYREHQQEMGELERDGLEQHGGPLRVVRGQTTILKPAKTEIFAAPTTQAAWDDVGTIGGGGPLLPTPWRPVQQSDPDGDGEPLVPRLTSRPRPSPEEPRSPLDRSLEWLERGHQDGAIDDANFTFMRGGLLAMHAASSPTRREDPTTNAWEDGTGTRPPVYTGLDYGRSQLRRLGRERTGLIGPVGFRPVS